MASSWKFSKRPSERKAVVLYPFEAKERLELDLRVGEIVTIYKTEDSGWWEGEAHGRYGIFPSNYVRLFVTLLSSSFVSIETERGNEKKKNNNNNNRIVAQCRVLFDFSARDDEELSITEGDVISIHAETVGWFEGSNRQGRSGLFPADFVELL